MLLPDLDAGCSLADSITADQLRAWKAKHPGAIVVMYVNTTAEVKAETDYCVTSSNAVAVVEHIYREHGEDTEILFGPDMFLGAYVEKHSGARCTSGTASATSTPASGRATSRRCAPPPGRRLPDPPRVRLLDLGHGVRGRGRRRLRRGRAHALDGRDARLRRARAAGTTAIMATETGMLHPLQMAAPDVDFVAANEAASCRFMKMITLPKLRDALRDGAAGQGARGDRGARAGADRADGRDRAVRPRVTRRARGAVHARAGRRPPDGRQRLAHVLELLRRPARIAISAAAARFAEVRPAW